jgi:hypothetical protein
MNFRINWEALGIGASLACAIHCAITPLLLSSLPLFGVNIVHNIWVEVGLLSIAFGIGISTLWHGYKKHHHHIITIGIFSIGILLFVLHQFIQFPYSTLIFVLPGVIAIIAAHLLNHRYCRMAKHCHTDDCNH